MKLKLLLSLMLMTFLLKAQEPYRSLIITEARFDQTNNAYCEITNVGDDPVQLSQFKFGHMTPWVPAVLDVWNDPWDPYHRFFFLPDRILQPGESFVIATAYDYGPKMYKKKVTGHEMDERNKQTEIYDIADILVHVSESDGDPADSVSNWEMVETMAVSQGRDCWYLEQHFENGDSIVIDQVNGNFDNAGQNFARAYDVAGVEGATYNSLLVRKYSVNQGNLDFYNARGVGLEDSEWIAIPRMYGYGWVDWRKLWWTAGNHGPYVLDENTLESEVIDVDFANKTLTVPWGVRRLDDIMRYMAEKPGIAWNYHLNENHADSIYRSARTGDKLTIYVCGESLQTATFDIIVSEPTAATNIVVPISHINIGTFSQGGPITTNNQGGLLDWPRVTRHDSGTDSITGTWHGLPNALRTDSLLKYLEKPANATLEFVWVDGIERPDLKNGDILKVTAQNGNEKEYFLHVQPYNPSHNAYLSAITWPDIPTKYKGVFGWMGDTIPNFNPTTRNYRVQVPFDVDGIPAFIAKAQNINAKVVVNRAKSLSGTTEDRTISFIVTAEDESETYTYNVELIKEKDPSKTQPYFAEPFLSELFYMDQWSNSFGEIVNPGNQIIDLSDYMIVMSWAPDPVAAIQSRMGEEEWLDRYDKYIPGYKWVSEAQWMVTPGILERDLSVNSIVYPGDVFCFGAINTDGMLAAGGAGYEWPVPKQLDVQFLQRDGSFGTYRNPWDEETSVYGSPIRKTSTASWFMFKILNDSIKLGLKPANDPSDFELIETFGMSDGSAWNIGGSNAAMITNYMRKSHIYKGNPEPEGSFGTNPDDTEWTWTNQAYWNAKGVGWSLNILNCGNDIGQHFMNEPTHYKSTVTSVVYKVSDGYSLKEEIRGLVAGTTVSAFFGNLNKANENQTLTVKSFADGSDLGMDDLLSLNDTLVVLSADSLNTTRYILEVSEDGLSSNAVLTSALYQIEIINDPKSASQDDNSGEGIVTGFEYGTQLRTILNNVTIPGGATLNIIDGSGAYVSLIKLNFDTTYVNVTVNSDTYFDVVAEDGLTRIVYQLQPLSSQSDAFILSDLYTVSQGDNLVHYVPRGTNVHTFLNSIVASLGASVKVVDKMGYERSEGALVEDDKIVVTSANGMVTRVYYLSMLRTQYIFESTYLAYVLSNVYAVDQVEYTIAGPTGTTLLSDFYARITPSMGATAIVVDSQGNERTSGDLDDGDMLKVTSADGKIVVMYELKLDLTSVDLTGVQQIEIYPNPTNGKLNVSGVKVGDRIQVFNSAGSLVIDYEANSNMGSLLLNNYPSGIYLIVVSNKNELLGRFKVVKQ
jgi:hypothetical protein